MMRKGLKGFEDESVPIHPDKAGHPLVVFGDHRFCAGRTRVVQRMPGPHMHSQVELNFVLRGRMTYRIEDRKIDVSSNRLVLFWGMVPHQVTDLEPGTEFVCLYVPMSVFLGLPAISRLREAIFRGAFIEALDVQPFDRPILMRWQDELNGGDDLQASIVRDELTARIRRLDREGWRDLREAAPLASHHASLDSGRILHVERMSRFIAENATGNITVGDVARAAGLHPNYAVSVYRRTTGMTINQAIIRHRLDTAQSLLIASDLPVSTIAFDCGFGSLSRFYEAFASRFGRTPGNFRKQMVAPAAATA
jgi:AraC-like DNA-binding protein/mannose-6-phosphate isomerase-like protein (cupin superfamily)